MCLTGLKLMHQKFQGRQFLCIFQLLKALSGPGISELATECQLFLMLTFLSDYSQERFSAFKNSRHQFRPTCIIQDISPSQSVSQLATVIASADLFQCHCSMCMRMCVHHTYCLKFSCTLLSGPSLTPPTPASYSCLSPLWTPMGLLSDSIAQSAFSRILY